MRHPNARAAASSSAIVATILYLLSLVGVDLPEPPLPVSIFLGGIIASLVLFIGREGFAGLFRRLARGES